MLPINYKCSYLIIIVKHVLFVRTQILLGGSSVASDRIIYIIIELIEMYVKYKVLKAVYRFSFDGF